MTKEQFDRLIAESDELDVRIGKAEKALSGIEDGVAYGLLKDQIAVMRRYRDILDARMQREKELVSQKESKPKVVRFSISVNGSEEQTGELNLRDAFNEFFERVWKEAGLR